MSIKFVAVGCPEIFAEVAKSGTSKLERSFMQKSSLGMRSPIVFIVCPFFCIVPSASFGICFTASSVAWSIKVKCPGKIVVKICPFLRLTGMEFEIFLNRLNSFARQCGSQMEFLLKGLQNINFDSLNFHQVLLIQKRIFQSEPCFSFYYDSILHEIKDLENKDPFVDSWRENMKNKLSILSELAGNVDDRVTFLSELYSDEFSEAEKKTIKKKFAEKTWNSEGLWR